MCVNAKWVTNKYTGQKLFVNCGHCAACQQQKAQIRTSRLKNSIKEGEIGLFVTLTYKNEFLPYIRRCDVERRVWPLPIYRDRTCRYVSNPYAGYSSSLRVNKQRVELDKIEAINYSKENVSKLLDAKKKKNCISVLYYKDVQNFVKRLRIYLSRRYGLERICRTFQCSEIGPTTHRAHFHLLIYIPAKYEEILREAIVTCWPYADSDRTANNIKLDTGAELYVSSYVNRSSDFPKIFESKDMRPKCSGSTGLGMVNVNFTLDKILEKANARDMRYCRYAIIGGTPSVITAAIPKYVINRYFPLVKGLSRLPVHSEYFDIFDFLRNPESAKVHYLVGPKDDECCTPLDKYIQSHPIEFSACHYDYSLFLDYLRNTVRIQSYADYLGLDDDAKLRACRVRLFNAARRAGYTNDCGVLDMYSYSIDYVDTWLARKMTSLKVWYEQQIDPLSIVESYDNIEDFLDNQSISDVYRFVRPGQDLNPNHYLFRIAMNDYYTNLFNVYQKRKKTANFCESKVFEDI